MSHQRPGVFLDKQGTFVHKQVVHVKMMVVHVQPQQQGMLEKTTTSTTADVAF